MRARLLTAAALAAFVLPIAARAQAPVATAFRDNAQSVGKNLIAAAEVMPADKYSFKPTPAQMSYGDIVVHLQEGNDLLCGKIGGMTAPKRSKLTGTAPKDALVARLKETFKFCDESFCKPRRLQALRGALTLRAEEIHPRRHRDDRDWRLGRPLQPDGDLPAFEQLVAADGEEVVEREKQRRRASMPAVFAFS